MIGVIVLSGPSPAMHGLDADRSPSLLPLGDRPALQHIIESLVTQGITSIELIVEHAPERVEYLLGNGDRWGCHFRYHLAAQPERPYRSLKIISAISTEPWVLIHAERYPCVDFGAMPPAKPVLYYGTFPWGTDTAPEMQSVQHSWGGTAVLPPAAVTEEFANYSFAELRLHFAQMVSDGAASVAGDAEWLDLSTPGRLLESQQKLLDKKYSGLLISGTERQPGIWVSRNVSIHPSTTLVPPLYIGPNSRLNKGAKIGPYAVIGADCIVDSNTIIEDALVVEGSYVGQALEVHKAIVSHNLLVNVRLDASIDISEDFLLGRLDRVRKSSGPGRILQAVLAFVLMLLFLPISILSALYYLLVRRLSYTSCKAVQIPVEEKSLAQQEYALLCMGADAWSVQRLAGWETFLRQLLPGLFAVMRGKLNFVGLPPRTLREIQALSEDWRALYLEGRAGLITEASTMATSSGDELQLYLADTYYSVQRSWFYDVKLAGRYFSRLIVPAKKT